VLQAQGVTLRSLDEMEAAQKQHTAAVNQSWERFLVKQDATVKELNAANMSFGDVVEGLAKRMKISAEDMALEIAGFGVKFGDTMGLVEKFGRDSIGKVITDFKGLQEQAKKEITIKTHHVTRRTTIFETKGAEFQKMDEGDVSQFGGIGGAGGAGATVITGTQTTAQALARAAPDLLARYNALFTPMQNGGIVRRPTLAMLGERGAEAVVPLGRGGGMGSMNVTVNIAEGAIVGVDDLQDTIAQTVRDTAERGGFRGVF